MGKSQGTSLHRYCCVLNVKTFLWGGHFAFFGNHAWIWFILLSNVKFAPSFFSYLVKGIGNNVDKANSKDISKDE